MTCKQGVITITMRCEVNLKLNKKFEVVDTYEMSQC